MHNCQLNVIVTTTVKVVHFAALRVSVLMELHAHLDLRRVKIAVILNMNAVPDAVLMIDVMTK